MGGHCRLRIVERVETKDLVTVELLVVYLVGKIVEMMVELDGSNVGWVDK